MIDITKKDIFLCEKDLRSLLGLKNIFSICRTDSLLDMILQIGVTLN